MRDLFDKEFQQEMDDFFDYIDHEVLGKPKPIKLTGNMVEMNIDEGENAITELIHEVDGVTVCEPLEDVLKREAK